MRPDPVRQRLLHQAQTARRPCDALGRLHQPHRFLPELQRAPASLPGSSPASPFAITAARSGTRFTEARSSNGHNRNIVFDHGHRSCMAIGLELRADDADANGSILHSNLFPKLNWFCQPTRTCTLNYATSQFPTKEGTGSVGGCSIPATKNHPMFIECSGFPVLFCSPVIHCDESVIVLIGNDDISPDHFSPFGFRVQQY